MSLKLILAGVMVAFTGAPAWGADVVADVKFSEGFYGIDVSGFF